METTLNYYRYVHAGDNRLLKSVVNDMKVKKSSWFLECTRHLNDLEIVEIQDESKISIKQRAREKDKQKWERELEAKSSLKIYAMMKLEIREEEIYDNQFDSVLLYKARSNTLQLENRKRFSGGDIACKLCGSEVEDLAHFVLECRLFNSERGNLEELQRPYIENQDELLGGFLFDKANIMIKKKYIGKIWKKRKVKLEEIESGAT